MKSILLSIILLFGVSTGLQALDAGQTFLEENKKKSGVVTLPSGLQYKIIEEGQGNSPKATDMVSVKYTGKFINGTVFDKSDTWVTFPVNQVIPGWQEALQLMKPGSKWIIFVPPQLAYGSRGAGNRIGPNETLIFEIGLNDNSNNKNKTNKTTTNKTNKNNNNDKNSKNNLNNSTYVDDEFKRKGDESFEEPVDVDTNVQNLSPG